MGKVATLEHDVAVGAVDFSTLFEEQFDYVWHTLRRLGVRERDLEDVAHEVFMLVHARLADFDASSPPRPWLFGFALRVAADYRKLARHRVDLVENVPDFVDPSPAPDVLAMQRERVALLYRALDSLAFERRAIFVLRELEGVDSRQAADMLGIPLNTAYSRLRLAREDFTAAVRRLEAKRGSSR